jgi:hypothetical protein
MLASELDYYDTFIFDGTKYDVWKLCMLNLFHRLGPFMEQNVVMGFLSYKGSPKLVFRGLGKFMS